HLIEKHKDLQFGGYYEAFSEDWEFIEDMRLSEKDANESKSMNTHLHLLEPYTNLCRIWDETTLKNAHKELIQIFCNHIIDMNTYHLQLFFNDRWQNKTTDISYGHDIEAAWLLYEAACIHDKESLKTNIKELVL